MKKGNVLLIVAGVAAAVVLALFLFRPIEPTGSDLVPVATATPATAVTTAPANEHIASPLPPSPPADSTADGDGDPTVIAFKVDAKGRIVTNEKARLDLERLYALYGPAERQTKLEELQQTLPPAAAQQLADLLEQYKNYQEAQYQNFPPDREMVSPEQGLAEIDSLHALRAQYFGEQTANGFFGEEEKVQRELYRLMAVETDKSLTMEERAERAQDLYSKSMPAVAAAEHKANEQNR